MLVHTLPFQLLAVLASQLRVLVSVTTSCRENGNLQELTTAMHPPVATPLPIMYSARINSQHTVDAIASTELWYEGIYNCVMTLRGLARTSLGR